MKDESSEGISGATLALSRLKAGIKLPMVLLYDMKNGFDLSVYHYKGFAVSGVSLDAVPWDLSNRPLCFLGIS